MGIPKLLANVTPYGERLPLDGEQIVVDGPALAYHALRVCQESPAPNSQDVHPFDRPTYSQLGDMVLTLLDELSDRGNTISALYFDGYLPRSKQKTRVERVYRASAVSKEVYVAYQPDILGFHANRLKKAIRPGALPFTVPAVIDVLRQSPQYGPLTQLVPGEADEYCAKHVLKNGGGTILTADSDLVVHDLGPKGRVVFLRDIDMKKLPAEQKTPLVVPVYSPVAICQRLSLDPHSGMRDFAFELFMDPYVTPAQLTQRARHADAASRYPEEYAEFVAPYASGGEVADTTRKLDINGLDPRVSEFVLQSLLKLGDAGGDSKQDAASAGTSDDEDEVIFSASLFFSPAILESWARTSAWQVSAPIRSCALGLVQILANRRFSAIREYTRQTTPASRGGLLEIPSVPQIQEDLGHFAKLLRRIQKHIAEPDLQWVVLSAYQDIVWSREHGKESTCLAVLRKETRSDGVLEQLTWNAAHWLAQMQGTLYSARILRQVLGFVGRETDSKQAEKVPSAAPELCKMLAAIPPFDEYPLLRSLQDLPARLKAAGGLRLLAKLAQPLEPIEFRAPSKDKKRKRQPKQTAAGGHSGKPTNSFALLDNAK